MITKERILLLVALVLCLGLGGGWLRSCQEVNQANQRTNAVSGELTLVTDKLGRSNYQLQSIEGSYAELKKIDAGKDTTLKRLQSVLAERKKKTAVVSAVSFGAVAKGRASTQKVVFAANTASDAKPPTLGIYPTYKGTVTSRRFSPEQPPTFSGTVTASKDSIAVDPYTIRVGFDIVQTETKKTITTTVRPTDPTIEVTSAASYTREKPKHRRGLAFGLGYVAGFLSRSFLP